MLSYIVDAMWLPRLIAHINAYPYIDIFLGAMTILDLLNLWDHRISRLCSVARFRQVRFLHFLLNEMESFHEVVQSM